MAPPFFESLGKAARDILGGGYNFGVASVSFKTEVEDSVQIGGGGSLNQETGKVVGNMMTKYKVKDYGLVFTEKWSTENTFSTAVASSDLLTKGLNMSLNTIFSPVNKKTVTKLKSEYTVDRFALDMDVELNPDGPIIDGSSVIGLGRWLFGYQMSFNSPEFKFTKNNYAVGYSIGDFSVHSYVNDYKYYGGSIYRKVNPQLETGIMLSWTADSADSQLELGCRYSLGENTVMRAKVNNLSQVGLSYQQKLREGVTLTLSLLLDWKNFNEGGHKIGFALDLEA